MRKHSEKVGGDHDGWADEEEPLEGRGGWHGWEERGEGAHVDGQRRTQTGSSRVDRTEQPPRVARARPPHTSPRLSRSRATRAPSLSRHVCLRAKALLLFVCTRPAFGASPSSAMLSTSDSLSSPELHGSLVLCSI